MAQRLARTARVLLFLAVSLRVLAESNSSVAILLVNHSHRVGCEAERTPGGNGGRSAGSFFSARRCGRVCLGRCVFSATLCLALIGKGGTSWGLAVPFLG